MDSNLGRGASVKKTRSVFSPRARAPAGGRSRCGSAERIRGILYAAPIEIESLRQRGLFFYGDTAWIRTSVEARALRKRGAFLARGRGRRQAAEAGADPRSGYAESYTPHQLKLKASGNGGFSFMATPHGFEPRSRRERLNRCFVKIFPNCRLTHRGVTCIIIRALRRYLSWIEGLTTNQNVIGSNPIRRTS